MKSHLKIYYDLVSWADIGLVIAIVLYMAGPAGQDALPVITIGTNALPDTTYLFKYLNNAGLLLTIISLVVTIAAITIARLLYTQGESTHTRWILRCIGWGIWIPIDLFFLVTILSSATA